MKKILVKLCGNHSLNDLKLSIESGVPYIGIVFAESKRKVDPVECGIWLQQLEKSPQQKLVGVFVNPTLADIIHVLKFVPLDIIQFHGLETSAEIMKIKEETGLFVWKAIHHDAHGIIKMKEFQDVVDGYVIDSKVKGVWGGTGHRFDWEAIPFYAAEAKRQGVPCLIAGGITPENVKDISAYNPPGIDLASGIETGGKKNQRKIQLLKEKLKEHSQKFLS